MIKIKRLSYCDKDKAWEVAKTFYPSNTGCEYNETFLRNKRNYLLAAYVDNILTGFLLAYELERLEHNHPMMFLYTIDVLTEYRRKGIGRQLINKLKEICTVKKFMKMFVITNESNIPAMKLYHSTGGERTSEDDVVILYK